MQRKIETDLEVDFSSAPSKLQAMPVHLPQIVSLRSLQMLTLTCGQVRLIDQLAAEQYAMPTIILMENASANAAQIIGQEFSRLPTRTAAIFCGPGNNGGDGFAIARHLHNAGWSVQIVLSTTSEKLKGDALINYTIATKMDLAINPPERADEILSKADIVIDALLGTGTTGRPRPPIDTLIKKINAAGKPVVAIDIPSGLDCVEKKPSEPTIHAAHTITFVAAKNFFSSPDVEPYLGKLHVAQIGVPSELIEQVQDKPI
jgi:NAD(P)H-hydrate epimerase